MSRRNATMDRMTERMLTTKALADALDVHPETVRRWVRSGALTPTTRTPGGQARWDLEDVRRQLREHEEPEPVRREPTVPPVEELRRPRRGEVPPDWKPLGE